MIYVCITARDHASSVGLVLWKLRKVFLDFPREYHLLVADDGSTDGTRQVLETYQRSLPMSLVRHDPARGPAAALEGLLRTAVARTDRPRRDAAVTLPPDFSVSPAVLPDLLKRFESGADLVVGETVSTGSFWLRAVRRAAPWLMRPGIILPGLRDVTSGVAVVRLVTLKNALREDSGTVLQSDGAAVHVELVARAATAARQIAAVPLVEDVATAGPAAGMRPLDLALDFFRAGRRIRLPGPSVEIQRS